jgi:hypothetical protein
MSEMKAKLQFVEIFGKDIVNRDVDPENGIIYKQQDGTFLFTYTAVGNREINVKYAKFDKKRMMFLIRSDTFKSSEHGATIVGLHGEEW